MSATPQWLDEDAAGTKPQPPSIPSSRDSMRTPMSNQPSVTPPTTALGKAALEEAGLGFLCVENQSAPAGPSPPKLTSPAPPRSPPPSLVVVEKKHGALIEDNTFQSNASVPAHFVRRMQQAEAQRNGKAVDKLNGSDDGRGPAPPGTVKPSKNFKRPVKPAAKPAQDDSSATKAVLKIGELEEASPAVDLTVVPAIKPEDEARYPALIDCFGKHVVQKMLSPYFQHRLQAQGEFADLIDGKGAAANPAEVDLYLTAVTVGLKDNVVQVVTASAQLCREYLTKNSIGSSDALEAVAAQTVKRLKEQNARCSESCQSLLNALIQNKRCGAQRVLEVVCASTTESTADAGVRSTTARLEYCLSLLQSRRDIVMDYWKVITKFAAVGLASSNNKIRRLSISIITYVYPVAGKNLETYLAGVNPSTIKRLLQELGESGQSADTQDMLTPSVANLDHVEKRQEEEDLAAMEAERSLDTEKDMISGLWADSLHLRSAKCMFSSRWKVREHLMDRLGNLIANSAHGVVKEPSQTLDFKNPTIVTCISQILEKALSDSVPAVVSAALRVTKLTFSRIPARYAWDFIYSLIPLFVKHSSSSQLSDTVLDVVKMSFAAAGIKPDMFIHSVVGSESTAAELSKIAPRTLQSRMEILLHLISMMPQLEGSSEGGDGLLKLCMQTCAKYLEVPNPKVKMASCNVVVEIHQRVGSAIQPYLVGMSGSVIEELKSRLTANGTHGKQVKAQRLFNIVKPLSDASLSAPPAAADGGGSNIKDRIIEYQKKKQHEAAGGSEEDFTQKEAQEKKEMMRICGVDCQSMPRSTPGKKSRLVFA